MVTSKTTETEGPDMEAAKTDAKWIVDLDSVDEYHNLARAHLQVLAELEDLRELHRPRHTADGEWPEEGQEIWLLGSDEGWFPWTAKVPGAVEGTWLPSPPKPRGR